MLGGFRCGCPQGYVQHYQWNQCVGESTVAESVWVSHHDSNEHEGTIGGSTESQQSSLRTCVISNYFKTAARSTVEMNPSKAMIMFPPQTTN